jgi:hypothetical protein
MRGKGSGFGMVMLLVVLAVVLFLVAQSWRSVAPEAIAVTDHGQPEAAGAIHSGDLPDLEEMKQRTDGRAAEVEAILEQSE